MDKSNLRHGISAAGTSFALPGIFNFNGAKYNISTGQSSPFHLLHHVIEITVCA
ncbi:hypothetical protein HYDPIDRAFT_119713 [Hydnomerulius pinastri MD-312]|uniref:Uncharacterized protein n=1 Tax=Hydnomerulius pinastri MD-312 TaxID=994086 RepID=A0A0C9VL38_9AGAM|nr:hypothetical protein HYDPIDRAFT_119713 [Hydnomerulius pinastri MD-312]